MTTYDERRLTERRVDLVRECVAQIGAGLTVLDLGTGSGAFARALAQDGHRVTAVDRDVSWAGQLPAEIRLVEQNVKASIVQYLGRFDVVLALSVLHHFRDWLQALESLRAHVARRALIVEVPHPEERLRKAPARRELRLLKAEVQAAATRTLGEHPSVYETDLWRTIDVVSPLVQGAVFGGGGNHAKTQRRIGEWFERVCGYRPYPGSLNLRLDGGRDLGPAQDVVAGPRRRYELWRARVAGAPDLSAHLMNPVPHGSHGRDTVELLAPCSLREALSLGDGDRVGVEPLW